MDRTVEKSLDNSAILSGSNIGIETLSKAYTHVLKYIRRERPDDAQEIWTMLFGNMSNAIVYGEQR